MWLERVKLWWRQKCRQGTYVLVVGSLFGDEAKGKLTDLLAKYADVVVRWAGGNNAGHTIIHGGLTHKLHLLPSGVLHEHITNVIGCGTVIDPVVLCDELDELAKHGITLDSRRLLISRHAHLILPTHRLADALGDQQRIGTTGRGIGKAYETKAGRYGIRMEDLQRPDWKIEEMLGAEVQRFHVLYQERPSDDLEGDLVKWMEAARRLRPFIADTATFLNDALAAGKVVVGEGAQGWGIDLDHGTYPFVTSSSPTAGGACTGTGISPRKVDRVIAVVKAYSTRVGKGPFPTKVTDEAGKWMLEKGKERGTTTGRPRDCGWVDLVLLKYSLMISGWDWMFLTKLDVLSGLKELRVCVAYQLPDGSQVDRLADVPDLDAVTPVWETLPGWTEDIGHIRSFSDLPEAAQNYVEYLECALGVDAKMISVGPDRDQTIYR